MVQSLLLILITDKLEVIIIRILNNVIFLQRMKAAKCPSDELAITNCALVNPDDFHSDVK